jgi:hypothetical protein
MPVLPLKDKGNLFSSSTSLSPSSRTIFCQGINIVEGLASFESFEWLERNIKSWCL